MPEYKAPLRDIAFVRDELLGYESHYATLGYSEATADIVTTLLEEGAKFCEQELAPLNASGDAEGCTLCDGAVKTPRGFKAAYEKYIAAGWPSLAQDPPYGGQGLPQSLDLAINEMMGQANWAWSMYPGLSQGAMHTLARHGSVQQKELYLPHLVSGKWTGTMCLTESQCGTDLGLIKTKALPEPDGSYKITGTKIFISAGEHDLAENIVHIILARLPEAPKGTRGISLFIVPKILPTETGLGAANKVLCGGVEQKMGIHGNATCVLNFDGAQGFLVGEANKGLDCMFTFMNMARLGTAMQGLAHAELASQWGLDYARERLQMRSLSGIKQPDQVADPILVHPDIRRMLFTIKAFSEGNRAFSYYIAKLVDRVKKETGTKAQQADDLLSFLTPIAKAFMTEVGFEAANLGLQIYGGHGYIRESGVEQNVRDARIATIYEGTTGIQALDLLGRKVLLSKGALTQSFIHEVQAFCTTHQESPAIKNYVKSLQELLKEWQSASMEIGLKALKNPDEVGASAFDYLMYCGYVILAYFWADMARVASATQARGLERDFYAGKLATARFYFARILPRASLHKTLMLAGAEHLMSLPSAGFGPE